MLLQSNIVLLSYIDRLHHPKQPLSLLIYQITPV